MYIVYISVLSFMAELYLVPPQYSTSIDDNLPFPRIKSDIILLEIIDRANLPFYSTFNYTNTIIIIFQAPSKLQDIIAGYARSLL